MGSLPYLKRNPFEVSQSFDINASTSMNNGENNLQTCDFTSETTLNFLKQMLLEEDIDAKVDTYKEEASLHATEKSFYDILGQDYPSSSYGYTSHISDNQETYTCYHESDIGATSGTEEKDICCDVPTDDTHSLVDGGLISTLPVENLFAPNTSVVGHLDCQNQNGVEVVNNDPIFTVAVKSLLSWQIQKGAEEAMKFLPKIGKLCIDFDECKFQKVNERGLLFDKERRSSCYSKSRKSHTDGNMDLLYGRINKQIALCTEEPVRNEMSDKVLLILGTKYVEEVTSVREIIQMELRNESWQNDVETSRSVIEHNQKQVGFVNIISLLINCSQAISTNDCKTGLEMIKQIKEHASPNGNWSERLAHYFADGLYARLTGTGSEIYHRLITQPSFSDNMKAYHMHFATCPYKKALFSFANQSIFNISKNASKIHIVNYGVAHGFQWPSFFERFANWKNSLPKIRMTTIEVPEPGFHPTKRLDTVGRRLAFYAKIFNIPFKHQGIASKWENVKPEDLIISNDELVIVNCISAFNQIPGEAISDGSPRDNFLKTIRSIKPCMFIHGFANGSYDSPFFAASFKSMLSYYSSLFDMLSSIMPRNNPERLRIERDIYIPYAINAIACEVSERIVRPETYKQWQRRYLRAGFVQVPVDPVIIKNIKDFVRGYYHKEFVIEEEKGWLLVGWKGRILYAQSAWKPDEV